jgi:hypothetical protein
MAQKSLLSLIQTISGELNLPQPTTVLSSTEKNVLKLLALTRAVMDDMLAEYDWQQLQSRYTFTATGAESYSLPADYERMLDATAFNASNRWPVNGPLTPAEWEWAKNNITVGSPFVRYRIYGDKFYVLPTGTTATFNLEYISNYLVKNGNTGAAQADFTQDSDVCAYDHRVIVYGVKLKWLESIGNDTTAALADFKRALEASKGSDEPGRRLSLIGSTGGFVPITTANIPDWA